VYTVTYERNDGEVIMLECANLMEVAEALRWLKCDKAAVYNPDGLRLVDFI
jgi:hypothetical protein